VIPGSESAGPVLIEGIEGAVPQMEDLALANPTLPAVIFCLAADCSYAPDAPTPLPGALVYKNFNVTEPNWVRMALTYARVSRRFQLHFSLLKTKWWGRSWP